MKILDVILIKDEKFFLSPKKLLKCSQLCNMAKNYKYPMLFKSVNKDLQTNLKT